MNEIHLFFPHGLYCFLIQSDLDDFSDFLKRYYGFCVKEKREDAVPQVEILISKKDFLITVTCQNKAQHYPILSLKKEWLFTQVEEIVESYFVFEPEWNVYHGSAVCINEKVFLFLGKTKAGKTTLTAFLSQQKKALVLAEEYVIVNFKTREVAVTPHPLLLRESGYNLLAQKYKISFPNSQPFGSVVDPRVFCSYDFSDEIFSRRYFLNECLLPNLSEESLKTQLIVDPNEYVLNSYLSCDMKKNILSASFLIKTLPIRKLFYKDLNETYNFLWHLTVNK